MDPSFLYADSEDSDQTGQICCALDYHRHSFWDLLLEGACYIKHSQVNIAYESLMVLQRNHIE